jgi:hypothetical protein
MKNFYMEKNRKINNKVVKMGDGEGAIFPSGFNV